MKIAVPYDNGEVFQHFGRTEAFKYYELEGGFITPGDVIPTGGTSHEALADHLADRHVDVVICGGLGDGAKRALEELGIQVVSGASGDVDAAVAAYLAGDLTGGEANCSHDHGEESGCGGECGGGCGHGCGGCGHTMPIDPIDGKNVGKTVRVHYQGTFDDGTQFDSSYDRGEPLEFVCGAGQMIRGFDQAVADMEPGETVSVHLMPEDAYGMPNPNAVFSFAVSDLPGSEDLKVGQRVHLQADSGQVIPVRVAAREGDQITLDANHEMAGKELNFKIELVEIL
ncbi:MAG: FKBP-type peptidyl-prolyl cis-trans isomerase [Lachnospiraceae bacterium]|jgi:FKBP-type peptidyl-prolyl cis-trans isomerase 2/predicted Fe-Mo cluster-binding NifX family protein|nr:FKBP-type peptidyl-prolyl cis-trans isomerase [Lachnospiraceae bacterium]MCI1328305.1 FKBP-type peptidyl-prolyl cis-trans isomerase [Lachnospiraceae bacterium]